MTHPSIPLKTTDDVDLVGPLRQFIRSTYGTVDRYSEECQTIHRLRQDMRGAGRDETGRDLLYRYYGQIELLELRFPIDEDHIRISFNWYDAFSETPTSQYSLAYEKASVLFNIAAILSYTASTQTRSEIDGMKKAYHSLQACAGLLNFINDNFLHAPSTDLSRETVKTLSLVMLAQAQEVFTEKQIRDSGKSSIIAKLAAEAANLYHNAGETITELVIAGNIDHVWQSYCLVKEKYFVSLAHYYQACFEDEKAKYGLSVARFALAQTFGKEAHTLAKTYSGQFARYGSLSNDPGTAMVEVTKNSLNLIIDKGNSARKENDVIYHETLVKENAIPVVAKLSSAKPISLHDLYAGQDIGRIVGHDIFHKLVPLSVHESASMYSEEIAKLLRQEQERSDVADTELSTGLDYLGLPKSLHQLKVSDDTLASDSANVPSHIQLSANSIVDSERHASVSSRLSTIASMRNQISDNITHLTRSLDQEERQCEAMRSQYHQTWTQTPSNQVTGGMRHDLQNYKQSLDAAAKSDNNLQSKYETVANEIKILADSHGNSLEYAFQSLMFDTKEQSQSSGPSLLDLEEDAPVSDIAIKLDQVEDSLRKLNLVKKERLSTLVDLKEKARKDDISDVLILNKKTPGIEQKLFATELEKFRPHQNRISATISRQEQLLEELTTTFTSVLKDKSNIKKQTKWDKIGRAKADLTRKIEEAVKIYPDLSEGSKRALQFYTDLKVLVDTIAQNVSQFISQRQQEGRQMLEHQTQQRPAHNTHNLRQQLDRLNMNGGNAANRPQPPPPSPYQRPY